MLVYDIMTRSKDDKNMRVTVAFAMAKIGNATRKNHPAVLTMIKDVIEETVSGVNWDLQGKLGAVEQIKRALKNSTKHQL